MEPEHHRDLLLAFSIESPELASVRITFLCETLTQRRKFNLNSSSALKSRFPMDEQDLGDLAARPRLWWEPRGPRAPGTGVSGGSFSQACPSPGHGHPSVFMLLVQRHPEPGSLPHQSDIQDSRARASHSPPCMALKRDRELRRLT